MVNAMDMGENAHPTPLLKLPKMKIKEIRHMIIICPASILANKRIISEKGLVKMLKNSTSTRMGFTPIGTGGLKICPQK